jgi:hypothetical protein
MSNFTPMIPKVATLAEIGAQYRVKCTCCGRTAPADEHKVVSRWCIGCSATQVYKAVSNTNFGANINRIMIPVVV